MFYFTLIGMTVMLNACNVIKVWILQATPWYAILILFTIACCHVAYNTFKVIVRFYVMASILILPMALLIALGLTRDFLIFFRLQRLDGGILFKHLKKQLQLCMVLKFSYRFPQSKREFCSKTKGHFYR